MAPRDLTTEEMLGLSGPWVRDPDTKKALAGHPRAAANQKDLLAAHEALLSIQSITTRNPELDRIEAEEQVADHLHDRKARGVNLVLAGLVELVDDDKLRQALSDARGVLQPDGLAFINLNFSAEAGAAEATRHRLAQHPEVTKVLTRVPLPEKKTLASEVDAWLAAGDRLGALETARRKQEQGDAAAPSNQPGAVKARNRWIRVVNAMLDQIRLDETPDPEISRLVLAPVQKALGRAEARSKRAPSPPEGPAGDEKPSGDDA